MTINEVMSVIHNAEKLGSIMGVETVKEMLNRLGNPQDKLKVIHIAGTNGKGSTASYIASSYVSNGYKVGLFTSPYFVEPREQISINGKEITECKLIRVSKEQAGKWLYLQKREVVAL